MTRLTEEMVIARSKQSDLSSIKKLNCWGSDLSDVSIIKRMRGVEVLALSVNKISTLQPFEDCLKLQELYLRKNCIQDINEIAYLQNLPNLKYLWLEENPCCERVGPAYRAIVLRALPNLKKLDNVEVTQEEVDEALRAGSGGGGGGGGGSAAVEDDPYDDAYEQQQLQEQQKQQQQQQQQYYEQQQQQQQQQYRQQQQQQEQQQRQSQQQQPPQPQYRRSSSPQKEVGGKPPQQTSPATTEESVSETNNANGSSSKASTPSQEQVLHSPSPKYNPTPKENRLSYHQYDRSPDTDQESPHGGGFRERAPIPPSASTHSMKEYYQSDRPSYPAHYRHSQSDLTEWDEHHQPHHASQNPYGSTAALHHMGQRRSAGTERPEPVDRYAYRNGRENGDWEDERPRPRRPDGRYADSASTVSTAVLNHYSGYHRRPINRSSNLLSATLCLVKELDYPSLEVVEHAVRCRIDELAAE
ncbi:dynein axonemal assembly factor 11 isoform X1 [Musca domestica]|uniref:Dynein axonemal assembly factor 11 isoform X1 n=1 Tax=Musca domestica TaxID=7370 RepID=A0A9J7IBE0_MUSDO|nr:dynein axonemal assembly factor 11 isoform X1 [Musca domestica]XP_019890164.1 dynein axonemal assembly factor 11 isoform X1 [Musca domestica]XP_019890166.1 dynein axonemal assembly factor 11 isoform X1 [Musca domestica]XP_019890167.1 dynein axonemal assembly factor 11 isoform X1 [Musca domestica]XP_019890168.1 dynein axonemal assembly factor 11 isoform X1 [Musca domestica]XP_019890169.1 dynein axonemal assembly factor 11 isoform X1 [Musca domestica]XP_019890170.1 dynein axonemal assembly f